MLLNLVLAALLYTYQYAYSKHQSLREQGVTDYIDSDAVNDLRERIPEVARSRRLEAATSFKLGFGPDFTFSVVDYGFNVSDTNDESTLKIVREVEVTVGDFVSHLPKGKTTLTLELRDLHGVIQSQTLELKYKSELNTAFTHFGRAIQNSIKALGATEIEVALLGLGKMAYFLLSVTFMTEVQKLKFVQAIKNEVETTFGPNEIAEYIKTNKKVLEKKLFEELVPVPIETENVRHYMRAIEGLVNKTTAGSPSVALKSAGAAKEEKKREAAIVKTTAGSFSIAPKSDGAANEKKQETSTGLSGSIIVVIILSAIVALIAVVVLIMYLMRLLKRDA